MILFEITFHCAYYPLDHTEEATSIPQAEYDNLVTIPLLATWLLVRRLLAEQNITDNITLPLRLLVMRLRSCCRFAAKVWIEARRTMYTTLECKEQPAWFKWRYRRCYHRFTLATVKRFFKEQDHIRLQPENFFYGAHHYH